MTVLGLDASTGAVDVVLAHGGSWAAGADPADRWPRAYRPGPARPAATLLDVVSGLLAASGLSLDVLDGVAVAVGPGSYAGVRAAVATAKALAWAAELPLAAVGSLEALAFAAGPPPAVVAAALDARRGRVYGAVYRVAGGLPSAVVPPALWSRAHWVEAVRGILGAARPEGGGCRLAGAGWLPEDVAALGDILESPFTLTPRSGGAAAHLADLGPLPASREEGTGPLHVAHGVAAVGMLRLARGEGVDPLTLVPAYVSEPDIGPVRAGVGPGG